MSRNCPSAKRCFKCKRSKPIEQFYPHPQMADLHLNKCKTCTKKDVRNPKYRARIIEYEKQRAQKPERRAASLEYQRNRRAARPGKSRARHAVNNAIRDGRLTRLPCEKCGNPKSEAHHPDYRKPLAVQWLCRKHHLEEEGKTSYAS